MKLTRSTMRMVIRVRRVCKSANQVTFKGFLVRVVVNEQRLSKKTRAVTRGHSDKFAWIAKKWFCKWFELKAQRDDFSLLNLSFNTN